MRKSKESSKLICKAMAAILRVMKQNTIPYKTIDYSKTIKKFSKKYGISEKHIRSVGGW